MMKSADTPSTIQSAEMSAAAGKPLRIVHLSDPHLPIHIAPTLPQLCSKRILGWLNWQRRRHHHQPQVLQAICDDIAEQSPDHILVSGDLVNIALPTEFEHALTWLQSLGPGSRVHFAPGNHDTYVKLPFSEGIGRFTPFMMGMRNGEYRAPTDFDDVPYHLDFGHTAVIALNSSPSTGPGLATGKIGEKQLAYLDKLLADPSLANRCVIVMLHHPAIAGMVSAHKKLLDGQALCDITERHEVDLVIHGHTHVPGYEAINGKVPHIGVASASYGGKGEAADQDGYLPAAQYHLYTVSPGEAGCSVQLEVRGLDLASGRVSTLKHIGIHSPQNGGFRGEFSDLAP